MSIHFSTTTEDVHVYENGGSYADRSAYVGVCKITYLGSFGGVISSMNGKFSRTDMLSILKHIHEQGASYAYAERGPTHGLPWGKRLPEDSPAGENWFIIDLKELFT